MTLPADGGTTRLRLTMCCPTCGRAARWLGRIVNAERQTNDGQRAGERRGVIIVQTRSGISPSWTLTFRLSCSKGHGWEEVANLPAHGEGRRLSLTMHCPACGRQAKTIGRRVDAARVAAEEASRVQHLSDRHAVLYTRVRHGTLERDE